MSIVPMKYDYNKETRGFTKGGGNIYQFQPSGQSSYVAGQSISIKVNSQSGFWDPQKSFLSYDLLTSGDTTSGAFTLAGGSAVLKDFTTIISGRTVEQINNYNVLCAISNQKSDKSRKTSLTILEGYKETIDGTAGSLSFQNVSRTVCHSPKNCISSVNTTLIPLPYISGGVEFQINTAPLSEIQNQAYLSGYTMSNVKYNAYLETPPLEIALGFENSLNAGSPARIKMPVVKSFQSKPVASTQNQHVFNVGINDSVRSVLSVERVAGSVQSTTTDDFANFTNNAKKEYYFQVNNNRYPQSGSIQCDNTSTKVSQAESYMYALISADNDSSLLSSTTDLWTGSAAGNNKDSFIYHDFSTSPEINSGIATLDGQIFMHTVYNTSPSASDVITSFVVIDNELVINPNRTVDVRSTGL